MGEKQQIYSIKWNFLQFLAKRLLYLNGGLLFLWKHIIEQQRGIYVLIHVIIDHLRNLFGIQTSWHQSILAVIR